MGRPVSEVTSKQHRLIVLSDALAKVQQSVNKALMWGTNRRMPGQLVGPTIQHTLEDTIAGLYGCLWSLQSAGDVSKDRIDSKRPEGHTLSDAKVGATAHRMPGPADTSEIVIEDTRTVWVIWVKFEHKRRFAKAVTNLEATADRLARQVTAPHATTQISQHLIVKVGGEWLMPGVIREHSRGDLEIECKNAAAERARDLGLDVDDIIVTLTTQEEQDLTQGESPLPFGSPPEILHD